MYELPDFIMVYGIFGLFSTGKDTIAKAFFYKCSPKALHYRVVIAITLFAHTYMNLMLMQKLLIASAG